MSLQLISIVIVNLEAESSIHRLSNETLKEDDTFALRLPPAVREEKSDELLQSGLRF